VPYQAFVGARETTSDTVSLRLGNGLSLDPMPTREAVDRIITATSSLSLEL
jgi:threonyl-tRNA synthetase